MVNNSSKKRRWSRGDKLSVALACMSAALGLILSLAPKTPLTVGAMILGIAGLLVYPIINFVSSKKARIMAFAVTLILVGIIGWSSWPKSTSPSTPPLIAPAPSVPTINQTATNSECSNLIAGSDAQIKCEAAEKEHNEKKTHP